MAPTLDSATWDRNEYVVHAKLKNNLLLSRILERAPTVSQFCALFDLRAGEVGKLVNMKATAIDRYGNWTVAALRVADALVYHPSELFSEEQMSTRLASNAVSFELSRAEAMTLADAGRLVENKEFFEKVLKTISHREGVVLRSRLEMDKTLEEVALELDVTLERVRQIELKALRKIKRRLDNEEADRKGRVTLSALSSPYFSRPIGHKRQKVEKYVAPATESKPNPTPKAKPMPQAAQVKAREWDRSYRFLAKWLDDELALSPYVFVDAEALREFFKFEGETPPMEKDNELFGHFCQDGRFSTVLTMRDGRYLYSFGKSNMDAARGVFERPAVAKQGSAG